ncbi:hypothetical protein Tco_1428772, partial [Tanacetum coccineum]
MAQQIIPAAQLISKFQGIRRCNNYVVLQSIICSPECKIVGHILLNHPLSYALTATADVPAVYLQQFWKTLPVETPDNPFIALVNIEIIESFMQNVGYQGIVDKINILQLFHAMVNRTNVDYVALLWWDFNNCVFQQKDVIQYLRFTKLIIVDLMNKYPSVPPRLKDDYHSIKYDIPLMSVYTTENVTIREMLISDAFLTKEIHATDDYKEYKTVFMKVDVPINQPQPVVSIQGMHRTTPRAHRTATLIAASPRGNKRKQSARETSSPRKSLKVTIRKKKQSTTS